MTTDDTTDELTAALQSLEGRVGCLEAQGEAAKRVTELIALVSDPTGCTARVAELQAEQAKLAKELRHLNRERIAAVAEATKAAEERDTRDRALAERERVISRREAELEILSQPQSPYARLRHFPGGMTAEPDDEPLPPLPRPPDEHEMELEKVGPSTGTLTRSVPRPKRSMRRVQPNA
jgi:hypothetical protein